MNISKKFNNYLQRNKNKLKEGEILIYGDYVVCGYLEEDKTFLICYRERFFTVCDRAYMVTVIRQNEF